MDEETIMNILVDKHDFSQERVKSQINNLNSIKNKKSQKGLRDFFG
jgi:hypothetical protein